jgi:hypothetical protein
VCLSEVATGGGREKMKMLENEKYWDNPSTYEYNIMYCTVNCWIWGEHVDRERVSNREEEGFNLIKAWHIQT